MANKNFEHVSHIKSQLTRDITPEEFYGLTPTADNSDAQGSSPVKLNLAKRPTADKLVEGEIAVNYLKGHETLTIKNTENEIVGFVNENEFNQSQEIVALGLAQEKNERMEDIARLENTISEVVGDKVDELRQDFEDFVSDTNDTELTISASLNDLNSRIIANKNEADSNFADINDRLDGINDNLINTFDGAEYDSNEKKINFKHGNDVVASIDATAFIKDGMVSNVTLQNGNLVITFNTDAGKQPISIALTDIFNPSNYYNKTEVDGLLDTKVDWVETTPGSKHIVLDNNDSILGTATDDSTHNIARITNADVVNLGSAQLRMNLDSENGIVTINDTKQVATTDDVNDMLNDYYDKDATDALLGGYLSIANYEDDELVISAALNDLNSRIIDNGNRITELEEMIDGAADEKIDQLREDMEDVELAVSSALNDLNSRLTDTGNKLDTELVNINETFSDMELTISASLNDLNTRIIENDEIIEENKEATNSEIESLKQQIIALTARVAALENNN